MDERQTNRVIGGAVLVIIAYFVIQMILPYLIVGVIGLVLWRIYRECHRP